MTDPRTHPVRDDLGVTMTAEEAPAAGYVVFHTEEPGEVIDVDRDDVFVLEEWA